MAGAGASDQKKNMADNKCFNCAECCRQLKVSVALEGMLKEWFAAHFNRNINRVSFRIKHNCLQLNEEGKCKTYEKRPKICRDHFCNREKQELLELNVSTTEMDI